MDSPQAVLYLTTAGVALFLSWKVLLKKERRADLPPMAPVGFFECLRAFFAGDVPYFLINMSRNMNCKVFALPIAPPGGHFICVADHAVARDILLNPRCTKPHDLYKFFDNVAC